MPTTACCKCFYHTRKLECPKCYHRLCTSCKPVDHRTPLRDNATTLEPEQVSDTPRSDAAATDGWSGDAVCTPLEFTQKLERENTKLQLRVKHLERQVQRFRRIASKLTVS